MDFLVVVCGPPGSGKSTIALPIANALRVPLIQKDVIKEALLDELGSGDLEWSRKLSRASFAAMCALAADLPEAVLEGNFGSDQAPSLRKLHPTPIEIFCRCERDELLKRIRERDRHPGHLDDITEREVAKGVPSDKPLRLGGPFMEVDTTEHVGIDELIAWVEQHR